MTTLDDQATEREELDRAIAMKFRKPELPITGFCWWCNEEARGCFCGPDCQSDWEQHQRFNR